MERYPWRDGDNHCFQCLDVTSSTKPHCFSTPAQSFFARLHFGERTCFIQGMRGDPLWRSGYQCGGQGTTAHWQQYKSDNSKLDKTWTSNGAKSHKLQSTQLKPGESWGHNTFPVIEHHPRCRTGCRTQMRAQPVVIQPARLGRHTARLAGLVRQGCTLTASGRWLCSEKRSRNKQRCQKQSPRWCWETSIASYTM